MVSTKSPHTQLSRAWKWRGRFSAVFVAVVSVVALTVSGSPASARLAANDAPLSGAGSSFAAPAIGSWINAVKVAPYNLSLSYTNSNSGTGRYEFTNQTVDFAVSDIGYVGTTDATPPSFPFNFIPITAGGIAFMYNIGGLTKQLQLSSYTACALLTGGITNWDSSALTADNPGVTLPNLPVVPVTESDSAGTNYVLEEWCIDEQPTLWAAFVKAQTEQQGGPTDGVALSATAPNSNWPGIQGGLDDQSTTAVAGNVADTNGAIGPVQVQYAKDANFDGSDPSKNVALVKNASGDYTGPTPVYDVSSALAYATQLPDGTHQLNFNGLGKNVYNPSTYSYLLTPTTGWSTTKGATMSQFVDYVLTLGQALAPSFGYASLGLSLEQYGIDAVQKNVPGAVAPTAAEQKAYSCGDLTPTEVQAGQITPTCGVVTVTAPPPAASAGTSTGAPVTSPASGTAATSTGSTAATGGSTTAGGAPAKAGGTTAGGTTAGGTASKTTAGSGSTAATSGSTATTGGVSPSVGLTPTAAGAGVSAMPNTGGNPVPLIALGAGLLTIGCMGRRRILNVRRRLLNQRSTEIR
ncbi:MAG: substrate-binding domain-containing protein [Acidimicrobiales bacterium]|jgi:phosphate transport system substrate-binding protein